MVLNALALARHRLDLLLLPSWPDTERATVESGWQALLRSGVAGDVGRRARLDLGDVVRFWANRTGGFRVACPRTGASVVPGFVRALERWRAGGERVLECGACGGVHPLERLAFAPDAGFARGAVCLDAVDDADPPAPVVAVLESVWGGVRVVARRG